MLPEINKIKGIHPGILLNRELNKRGIKKKELALMVDEHPQTISAIIKGKRSITPKLSIALSVKLGGEPEYFMFLQASFDIAKAQASFSRLKQNRPPIRKILFWDTNFDKIDWIKNKHAIIKRIFERGNAQEINEIIQYYGIDTVKKEIDSINYNYLPSFQNNVNKYLHAK